MCKFFLQFVEKFLSTYTIPKDVDITEPIWKELLTEVVHRFVYIYTFI